jgi:hypothetical protein
MSARTLSSTPFLRLALLGDAAASGATGLLLTTAARPLAPLLGLPTVLLHSAGLMLLPYAAFNARVERCNSSTPRCCSSRADATVQIVGTSPGVSLRSLIHLRSLSFAPTSICRRYLSRDPVGRFQIWYY